MPNITPRERFYKKTRAEGGCLLWTAATSGRGYGDFWFEGRLWKAHRWAYEQEKGRIPKGMDLDHLCRNITCVKVTHLEPVTRSENLRRGVPGIISILCPEGHDKRETGVPREHGSHLLRCGICYRKTAAARARRYRERKRNAEHNTEA